MPATDPFASLTCPMPDCDGDLYLAWDASVGLCNGTLTDDYNVIPISEATCMTWRVECAEGHVVLVPGPAGCACKTECDHGSTGDDGFDWSDEYRTFLRRDADRLRNLLDQPAINDHHERTETQ